MTKDEQDVYAIELRLIEKYFKGLQSRPIAIVRDIDCDGRAAEPAMLINARLLTDPEGLVRILKHELIHYELKDNGKEYDGHGRAFLNRARELGIVGEYELDRCFSLEEYEITPTRRRFVRMLLPEFKVKRIAEDFQALLKLAKKLPADLKAFPFVPDFQLSVDGYCHAFEQGEAEVAEPVAEGETRRMPRAEFKEKRIDAGFATLLAIAERSPDKHKLKAYPLVRGLQASVGSYCNALERGEDYVLEEFLRKKPGPKGKSLLERTDEFDKLKAEQKALMEAAGETASSFPRDIKVRRRWARIEDRMQAICEKVEEDFGVSLA